MFNEYLKPVRSFQVTTSYEFAEIDTHGLLAFVKITDAPVCIFGPEDNHSDTPFFLSPGDFFKFNGKIKVKSMEFTNSVLHIMLFDKE